MRSRKARRRGNVIAEFALASAVLVPAMAGTFQFGYSFYLYNQVEAGVANGARYGSNRTYRSAGGVTDINKVKAAIQNMTVYGTPYPTNGMAPVVLGLTPAHVTVTFTLANSIPTKVKVSVSNFTIDAVFKTYTFNGKPYVEYPYAGRYAPIESEP